MTIITASLAVAKPASAKWYKALYYESKCLGVSAGTMTAGTQIITWDCVPHQDQNWGQYPYSGSYVQLWSGGSSAPMDTYSMCIALGSVNAFTNAFIWNCTYDTTDQAWEPVYVQNDSAGHPCYYFKNKKAADTTGYNMALTVDRYFDTHVGHPVYLFWWEGLDQQIWCEYDSYN
jgi:hypothetical protein